MEGGDEFDPFPGFYELCIEEHEGIDLNAPPENQWYHGRLDRTTTEDRLRVAGQPGSYLIRESDRKPGSYVLSYLGKTGFNHFRITAMCGDYYIGGRQFDSLSDLIGYYTGVSYLLKDERLQYPVPPPEPVDDRRKVKAILPYRGMPETDELNFDKGDVFTVHNELGDGWLWVTSQRTREDGLVFEELVEDLNGNIDPVESLSYFHPNITKEDAVQRLGQAGQGSFLVRPSDHSPGDYSLFFLCNKTVQRFRIEKQGRQYYMGGRYFDTLDAIIQRYTKEQIMEGYTLATPVIREIFDSESEKSVAQDYKRSKSIYETIRHMSGPSLVTNRNDKIIMRGWLSKKSQKTKKWKHFFFVLNGTELQLYFFENEKRSKPKGLIDLSYSSLYPVHDSLFGRPNCFQLVMNGLNTYSVYYLCAENADIAQDWVHSLKPYCQNTQAKKHPSISSALKEQRSLLIYICDAHRLPLRQVPHPYCVLSLNNVKVGRTQVGEGTDPIWSEEFILDDIPADIDSVSVAIYNYSKRSKDTELFQMTKQLCSLTSGEMYDEWFDLHPIQLTCREGGAIRVRLRYLHEVIMPVKEYTSLKELILSPDLKNVMAISSVVGGNDAAFAKALLRIFRREQQEAMLLRTVNEKEIEKEELVSTLFRGTSLATTLMDQHMKMTAIPFIHEALKDAVVKIVESKHSCELNPEMMDNAQELEANKEHFLNLMNDLVEHIFKSTDHCPLVLRYICGCLQKNVQAKWPNDPTVKTRVVSCFIFLRLLVPAILNPKGFNLVGETPSEMAYRALKLVAKSLQNLANLVEFGAKESFMTVNNLFIKRNKQRMVMFLDELSNVPDCPNRRERVSGEQGRDLASIHQICASHVDELRKLSDTPNSSALKKLVAITDMLTNHKRQYMGDTT
ncbi:LOW QUALITY PROTEIN: ras GTPase-activating protein 1-like [Liolophura sinensis]|uniref:LOW QUALITY PROTEIN: ras GTPase-activating protein 1-like n=1 Tax=Liolophura sinensis TaxID=3198878 RepID=UPI003158F1DF